MAINKVGSKGIEDGSVATADFAPGTVSSDKLQDNAVTNSKLTNTTVTLAGQSVTLGASATLANKFVDWQSVITADGSTGTTAVSGQGYFIDTTSAAHTLTLPASATIGDFIAIKDYAGTFNTNNLTIARNGHNIQGVANDSSITTNRASLVLVYVDSTKGWLYWEEHNVADLEKTLYITATGGTITTSGDFKIHTFTGDGNFVVSQTGAGAGPNDVDYLVVAGGGGAGWAQNRSSGGGGAGGFREAKTGNNGTHTASPLATPTGITLSTQTYPVTVGAGGSGGPSFGSSGSNSIFSSITSAGGGPGGSRGCFPGGLPGGSGGGSGGCNGWPGGTGNQPPVSPPQGNPGGSAFGAPGPSYNPNASGGGGGAGSSGTNGSSPSAGAGGAGVTTSINGSPVTRAGGGGGGTQAASVGSGGSGGGGAGATNNGTGGSGTANTGSGGGGTGIPPGPGGAGGVGGAGGKGIVIIRYKYQ